MKGMIEVKKCSFPEEWDDHVLSGGGHPLQLWSWGQVKASHGWEAERLLVDDNGETIGSAQVLVRHLPWPFKSLAYIPRGPVVGEGRRAEVLDALAEYVKAEMGSVVLTIEPHWRELTEVSGWKKSPNTILIPQTLILDLNKTEEELQATMSKKTRQYIRKSATEPLTIRRVKGREELQACLELYKETAKRAGFPIHDDEYYHDIFELMGDYSPVFASFQGDQPVAFLWLAISEAVAFELYGGMNDTGHELRANYALKWHAITTMKKWGIAEYDMNGLLNDGVSTFKRSFADHEDELAGTFDKPLSPFYGLWSKGLPLFKSIARKLK
jgi:peptidoglycan pentaglycine glycine transferase (the first glycine)